MGFNLEPITFIVKADIFFFFYILLYLLSFELLATCSLHIFSSVYKFLDFFIFEIFITSTQLLLYKDVKELNIYLDLQFSR